LGIRPFLANLGVSIFLPNFQDADFDGPLLPAADCCRMESTQDSLCLITHHSLLFYLFKNKNCAKTKNVKT
jgi:hypothetical protein